MILRATVMNMGMNWSKCYHNKTDETIITYPSSDLRAPVGRFNERSHWVTIDLGLTTRVTLTIQSCNCYECKRYNRKNRVCFRTQEQHLKNTIEVGESEEWAYQSSSLKTQIGLSLKSFWPLPFWLPPRSVP